jgi:hypothetical protein
MCDARERCEPKFTSKLLMCQDTDRFIFGPKLAGRPQKIGEPSMQSCSWMPVTRYELYRVLNSRALVTHDLNLGSNGTVVLKPITVLVTSLCSAHLPCVVSHLCIYLVYLYLSVIPQAYIIIYLLQVQESVALQRQLLEAMVAQSRHQLAFKFLYSSPMPCAGLMFSNDMLLSVIPILLSHIPICLVMTHDVSMYVISLRAYHSWLLLPNCVCRFGYDA